MSVATHVDAVLGVDSALVAKLRTLGGMARESAEAKGRRYVTEGRLRLLSMDRRHIEAVCRGNGDLYYAGYQRGGWYCDCPALGRCSHLVALQLVVIRPDR